MSELDYMWDETEYPAEPMEHETSEHCWCHPEAAYTDPETGVTVWVHRGLQ